MAQHEVSFNSTDAEREAAKRVADRFNCLVIENGGRPSDPFSLLMDLIAVHANGCPLDFARLENADDFNLMHDVGGISRHIDRDTGGLTDFFLPRFAKKEALQAA